MAIFDAAQDARYNHLVGVRWGGVGGGDKREKKQRGKREVNKGRRGENQWREKRKNKLRVTEKGYVYYFIVKNLAHGYNALNTGVRTREAGLRDNRSFFP